MHYYYVNKNRQEQIFNPVNAFFITLYAEMLQMLILLIFTPSFEQTLTLIQKIAAPMLITNSIGAAFFISILSDRKTIFERYSASFSNRALRIAERSVGIFHSGYTPEACQKVAQIIYEETGVAAVALTDTTHVMAFIGLEAIIISPTSPSPLATPKKRSSSISWFIPVVKKAPISAISQNTALWDRRWLSP